MDEMTDFNKFMIKVTQNVCSAVIGVALMVCTAILSIGTIQYLIDHIL